MGGLRGGMRGLLRRSLVSCPLSLCLVHLLSCLETCEGWQAFDCGLAFDAVLLELCHPLTRLHTQGMSAVWGVTPDASSEGCYIKAKDAVTALTWIDSQIAGHSRSNLGSMVVVSQDSSLRVVSLGEHAAVRNWKVGSLALSSVVAFPSQCHGACTAASSERLVLVGSWDCSIYLVSLDYGRVVQELNCGHDDAVSSLALSSSPSPQLISGHARFPPSTRHWACLSRRDTPRHRN